MESSINGILKQYGLYGGTPQGGADTSDMDTNATAAPTPGAPPVDPAIGQAPMANLQQAVSYAKQLGETARSSIHAGAKVAAQVQGIVGNAGAAVAQATAPPPAPTGAMDASTVTGLIRHHESNNNYTAINHDQPGNTASGAYQYTDPTWAGYGGYRSAALAPRAVQDQRAQEDVTKNLQRYGGDAFKAIAHHYLPAAAGDPSSWAQPYKLHSGQTVSPVADYVRATIAGTPLQGQFDAYLRHYTG